MRWIAAAAIVSAVLAPRAWAAPADALDKPVRVDWAGVKLTDALADLAKQAGIGFVLDPAMPASAREAAVSYSAEDVPLRLALGRALKAAGLRYALIGGAVWISTPDRVARKLVYKDAENLPEAEPMDRGEAMMLLSPYDEDPANELLGMTRVRPWRRPEPPTVNPATGLTDYPAPPVWIDSEDAGSARFRYTATPTYLKPEYKKEGADTSPEREALVRLLDLLRKHPEWTRAEIMRAVEEALAASGTPM